MGKKHKAQGRAGLKQKGQKQKPELESSWTQSPGLRSSHNAWVDSDDEEPRKQFRGFSQRSPHPTFTPPNTKLRNQPIAFVKAFRGPATENPLIEDTKDSADSRTGEEERKVDDRTHHNATSQGFETDDNALKMLDEMVISTGTLSNDKGLGVNVSAEKSTSDNKGVVQNHSGPDLSSTDLPFFVDTVGDDNYKRDRPIMPVEPARNISSRPTSSSSDHIVFRGRNQLRVIDDPVSQPTRRGPSHHNSKNTFSQRQENRPPNSMQEIKSQSGWPSAAEAAFVLSEKISHVSDGLASTLPAHGEQMAQDGRTMKPAWDQNLRSAEDWSAENKQDTWARNGPGSGQVTDELGIAALRNEVKQMLREKKSKSCSQKPGSVKSKKRGKRGRKKDQGQSANGLDLDWEDDQGEEAAYEDYMENLAAQLMSEGADVGSILPPHITQNEFVSGPSMVVDGREYNDDEFIHSDLEINDEDEANEGLSLDEALQNAIALGTSELSDDDLSSSDLGSSDLELELEYTEKEQWEDEEDLRQRRLDAKTDEQLARLWAKQQELGIDADDLIIDDGDYMEDPPEYGDVEAARVGLEQLTASSFGRSNTFRPKTRPRNSLTFPNASALADSVEQYGEAGFDIMDQERPSLRHVKKGRKGKLPPEIEGISDEDLRDELSHQWDRDRTKKSVRKMEREELRQQGLLGSSARKGKVDLSQKYLNGMTLKQVQDELREFLRNDDQNSRPFPPMDKKDRKSLHELASAFGLKSKSIGGGKNRFPVLYKTALTLAYSDADFLAIIEDASQGRSRVYGPRAMASRARRSAAKAGGRGGGFDRSAVTVRNGEVVGAGAAAIGQDSYGHRLMEKMGWTKGTALGKDGNGLLVPVEQVMRSGKAGLG